MPDHTLESLRKLSEADLAAEVAKVVMGWHRDFRLSQTHASYWRDANGPACSVAFFETLAAWPRVEDALDRRGLGPKYAKRLHDLLCLRELTHEHDVFWYLLRAPLRDRCCAAVLACQGEPPAGERQEGGTT